MLKKLEDLHKLIGTQKVILIVVLVLIYIPFCVSYNVCAASQQQPYFRQDVSIPPAQIFKPRLFDPDRWETIQNQISQKYTITVSVIPDKTENAILWVDMAAKSGLSETLVTTEGGVLIMVPKEMKPDQKNSGLTFYSGSTEVIGASFPWFKSALKNVFDSVMPYSGMTEIIETSLGVLGVGKYNTNIAGTLIEKSESHVPVEAHWDEIRVQGRWATPDRLRMEIPINLSQDEAKKILFKEGISLAIALRTSVSNHRAFLVVDRALQQVMMLPINPGAEFTYNTYLIGPSSVESVLHSLHIPNSKRLIATYKDKVVNVDRVDNWVLIYFTRNYTKTINQKVLKRLRYNEKRNVESYFQESKRYINKKYSKVIGVSGNKMVHLCNDRDYKDAQEIMSCLYSDLIDFDKLNKNPPPSSRMSTILPQRRMSLSINGKEYSDCIDAGRLGFKGHYLYTRVYHKNNGIILDLDGHWMDGGTLTLLTGVNK
jgi:hypothetical protein